MHFLVKSKLLMHRPITVRSHGAAAAAAAAAATAAFSCRNNCIPQYLIDLFTLCGSGNSCSNGAASKWVLTLFLQLLQWQTKCFNCYLPHSMNTLVPLQQKSRCRSRTVWNGSLQRIFYSLNSINFLLSLMISSPISVQKGGIQSIV